VHCRGMIAIVVAIVTSSFRLSHKTMRLLASRISDTIILEGQQLFSTAYSHL
jgi:hypothetical protein